LEVVIKNCNNIDDGTIEIKENTLNIKYAINGTGKSTLAKAIEIASSKKKNFDLLIPFKYKNIIDLPDERKPSIIGISDKQNVLIFNEAYVNTFIYKKEEVIENSFEIFIRTSDYDKRMEQIEKQIQDIKITFKDSQALNSMINDLIELSGCFGKSKSGYSAAGSIGKGIGKGNILENIPDQLLDYKEFLVSDSNTQWLKWQINGNNYIDIASKCPYCTGEIEEKKEKVLSIEKKYDAKTIEHLNKVIEVFKRLNKYFTKDTNEKIHIITHNIVGITEEQKNYLIEIKTQIDLLIEKLSNLKEIDYYSFKDDDKAIDLFKKYKIDLSFLSHLDTKETNLLIGKINTQIDIIVEKAGVLQGEINKQKIGIERTIGKYKDEINGFLKYAGFRYWIDIILDNDEKYRMKLKHLEYEEVVEDVDSFLSFGERNAFSLILFMYESLKKEGDIIILDDPISSFDKNKKFAILNMLFRGSNSFQGKTVLMLTHDFEPVIDIIVNLPHKFNNQPYVTYLTTKDGILEESKIERSDIKTFLTITTDNIKDLDENVNKLIYLRRLYDIMDEKKVAYNLVSSLLHKREKPTLRTIVEDNSVVEIEMTDEEIKVAEIEIKSKIPNFDYQEILSKLSDDYKIIQIYKKSNNNYERLQVYRILCPDNHENEIIRKFVNETYHLENDYILQLNPFKYELIPQYIIDECTKDIEIIEQNIGNS